MKSGRTLLAGTALLAMLPGGPSAFGRAAEPSPSTLPLAAAGQDMHPMDYPDTRRLDLVEDKFGEAIADPYRWLENDVRTDKDVEAWVEAENAVT